jgi:hypothetical protein
LQHDDSANTIVNIPDALSRMCAAMDATMVVMATTTSSLASCIAKRVGISVQFGSSI